MVALLFSLGGGAYAATMMNGSQIAPHSIQGNLIVDHAIGSRQLAATQMTWHRLQLVNGWKSSQSAFATGVPRYAVLNGIAYLAGSLHGGTSTTFATVSYPVTS